jgi:hypothetical protein
MKFQKALSYLILVLLILAAVLPARRAIVTLVVDIAAVLLWAGQTLLSILPQQILWLFLIIFLLYIAVGSFYGKGTKQEGNRESPFPVEGKVKSLADWIEHRERGIYYNWRVANLLGQVARHILEQRDDSLPDRSLLGRDWSPEPMIQDYLEAGLTKTFADFPVRRLLKRSAPTPFDIPLEAVVDYLEEQMEIKHEE